VELLALDQKVEDQCRRRLQNGQRTLPRVFQKAFLVPAESPRLSSKSTRRGNEPKMAHRIEANVEQLPNSIRAPLKVIRIIILLGPMIVNIIPILHHDYETGWRMKSKWIGLAEVKSARGFDVLNGARGAYVNVLALAQNPDEFVKTVRVSMEENHLELIRIKDIDPIDVRITTGKMIPYLVELSARLSEQYPVQFDEFQSFQEE
jgi:hypothetical protein